MNPAGGLRYDQIFGFSKCQQKKLWPDQYGRHTQKIEDFGMIFLKKIPKLLVQARQRLQDDKIMFQVTTGHQRSPQGQISEKFSKKFIFQNKIFDHQMASNSYYDYFKFLVRSSLVGNVRFCKPETAVPRPRCMFYQNKILLQIA